MIKQSNGAPERFEVLDSFRGLFALSVVIFHLHILDSFTEWSFFRSAGLFVEYFFTLSGFVMAHSYARKEFDAARFGRFMVSRFFRIVPLHWLMLFAYSALLLVRAYQDGGLSGMTGSDEFRNEWLANFSLLQAWLPQANPFSFNGPAWTISVEFYIYVVFGLLLLAFTRLRQAAFVLIVLACVLCVLSGAGFAASGGFRGITCYFLGAAIYPLSRRTASWSLSPRQATLAEILALAACHACLTLDYPMRSLLASCFFGLFILLFAREAGLVSRWLRHPVFELLGRWSYSIYLTHFLVISLLVQFAASLSRQSQHPWLKLVPRGELLFLDTGSVPGNTLLPLGVLVLVVGISGMSYRYVEKTGMVLGKRISAGKPQGFR